MYIFKSKIVKQKNISFKNLQKIDTLLNGQDIEKKIFKFPCNGSVFHIRFNKSNVLYNLNLINHK
jgi:hypothetical protein